MPAGRNLLLPRRSRSWCWKPVGSWVGRGDEQTETFTSDTGGFRVHWETTNETQAGGRRLRVVFRSGDSGREIIEAIDARGAGGGDRRSRGRAAALVLPHDRIGERRLDGQRSTSDRRRQVAQLGLPPQASPCATDCRMNA